MKHFAEVSYYTVLETVNNGHKFKVVNRKNGETAIIGKDYMDMFCTNPYDFDEVIEIGKRDKLWTANQLEATMFASGQEKPRVGDVRVPGIETVWNSIGKGDIFTAVFRKQDEKLSKKEVARLKEEQTQKVVSAVRSATVDNFLSTIEGIIEEIQANPVLDHKPGELRTLVGYKVQFSSPDGFYQVVDLEKEGNGGKPNASVNINTLEELIINRKKYIVK